MLTFAVSAIDFAFPLDQLSDSRISGLYNADSFTLRPGTAGEDWRRHSRHAIIASFVSLFTSFPSFFFSPYFLFFCGLFVFSFPLIVLFLFVLYLHFRFLRLCVFLLIFLFLLLLPLPPNSSQPLLLVHILFTKDLSTLIF